MVEHLLIGSLAAVLVPGAQMLHFDAVQFPDPLIHPSLECIHGVEIGGNGVGSPHIGCGDPVQRRPPAVDHLKHLQTVLAIGNSSHIFRISHTQSSLSHQRMGRTAGERLRFRGI
jgi:hypothetical protein